MQNQKKNATQNGHISITDRRIIILMPFLIPTEPELFLFWAFFTLFARAIFNRASSFTTPAYITNTSQKTFDFPISFFPFLARMLYFPTNDVISKKSYEILLSHFLALWLVDGDVMCNFLQFHWSKPCAFLTLVSIYFIQSVKILRFMRVSMKKNEQNCKK